jgi:hypothetical protein
MNIFYEKKCYKILVEAEEKVYERQILNNDTLLVPIIIPYE